MENWVIFKDIRMMRSMSRMRILRVTFRVRQVRPLTTSPVAFVARSCFHRNDLVRFGAHDGG